MLPNANINLLDLDEKHGNYFCSTAAHEAGFDSYLTAKVLIRLATKLEAAGTYVEAPVSAPAFGSGPRFARGNARGSPAVVSSDEDYFTPDEGGVRINGNYHSTRTRVSDSNSGGVPVLDNLNLQDNDLQTYPIGSKGKSARKIRKAKLEDEATRFAHKGMFDMLRDLPTDMDSNKGSL
jgi:poly(A)-specific ribonuclease